MGDRIDAVVFGATGFTGKYTVATLDRLASKHPELTWGIAGRSEEKLKKVLSDLSEKTGKDYSKIPLIIADVSNEESLNEMASRAKLIINCCGPYRFYGEQVVKACVEAGTHHVDVSGEPQYMERMQLVYNEKAKEKGVYIISACGFDSIPADLGTVFVTNKFEGTVNSIETYLETAAKNETQPKKGPSANFGTWESAVYGLAHAGELRELRQKLFPERLPKLKPQLSRRSMIHTTEVMPGKWCVPFPGSDRSVVMRSQHHFFTNDKRRPVQMQAYFTLDSIFAVMALAIIGTVFSILTKFKFGRSLLLKYPSFFSGGLFGKDEPAAEDADNTIFKMTFVVEGWSGEKKLAEPTDEFAEPTNKVLVAQMSADNPGYGFTSLCLVLSGLTILFEKDKMPFNGGVLPPGAAFAKTSLMERILENDVTFEILDTKTKP